MKWLAILVVALVGCGEKKEARERGPEPVDSPPETPARKAPPPVNTPAPSPTAEQDAAPNPPPKLLKMVPETLDGMETVSRQGEGALALATYVDPETKRRVDLNLQYLGVEQVAEFEKELEAYSRDEAAQADHSPFELSGFAGYSRVVRGKKTSEAVVLANRVRVRVVVRPMSGEDDAAEVIKQLKLKEISQAK